MDGLIDGWTDGQMNDKWMDGLIHSLTDLLHWSSSREDSGLPGYHLWAMAQSGSPFPAQTLGCGPSGSHWWNVAHWQECFQAPPALVEVPWVGAHACGCTLAYTAPPALQSVLTGCSPLPTGLSIWSPGPCTWRPDAVTQRWHWGCVSPAAPAPVSCPSSWWSHAAAACRVGSPSSSCSCSLSSIASSHSPSCRPHRPPASRSPSPDAAWTEGRAPKPRPSASLGPCQWNNPEQHRWGLWSSARGPGRCKSISWCPRWPLVPSVSEREWGSWWGHGCCSRGPNQAEQIDSMFQVPWFFLPLSPNYRSINRKEFFFFTFRAKMVLFYFVGC